MEVCPETERIAIEASAPVCDDALQIGKGLEVLVCERLIQNRPEVLSRLKLGRVRGQVGEPDAIRHRQVRLRLADDAAYLVGEMNVLVGLGAAADTTRHVGRIRISFHDIQDDSCVDPVSQT